MPLRTDNVQLTLPPHAASERCANAACATYFLDAMRREDLRCVRSIEVERRSSLLGDVERFGELELRWRVEEGEDAVLRVDHDGEAVVVLIVGEEGMCEVVAAALDYDAANAVAARLADALRDPPPPEARLALRFWSQAAHGPSWRQRHVEADRWDAIARNYPAAVRAQLDALTALREPRGGSLILWHGPPGTGKTHALRALARAWEPWASAAFAPARPSASRGRCAKPRARRGECASRSAHPSHAGGEGASSAARRAPAVRTHRRRRAAARPLPRRRRGRRR